MKTPREIIDLMMKEDAFSKLLGMEIQSIKEGECKLSLIVKENFVNGFNIAHGGLSYALADSSLAFAANSYGRKAVSVETSISHTRPCFKDDILTVICSEENKGKRLGIYIAKVYNQEKKLIALFKGTVHFSEELW